MVYAAIAAVIAVDIILVIVIGAFILGARAREDAHRHP
jgi:hypothetical protein